MARKDENPCSNEPIREEYKPTWDDVKPGAVFKSFHSWNNSLSSKPFGREAHHFYPPSTCFMTERAATVLPELLKPNGTSRWAYSLFAKSCNIRKVALVYTRQNTWFHFIKKKKKFPFLKLLYLWMFFPKLVPLYKINLTLFLFAEFSRENHQIINIKARNSHLQCCRDTLCKHRCKILLEVRIFDGKEPSIVIFC